MIVICVTYFCGTLGCLVCVILTETKEQRVDRHLIDIEEYSADEVGGDAQNDGGNVVVVQWLALRHLVYQVPLEQVVHAHAHSHRYQQFGQEEQKVCYLEIYSLINNILNKRN